MAGGAHLKEEPDMPAKSNNHKGGQIQVFVEEQLEEAQRRFSAFEADAEKMLKHLIQRGKEQRKELQGLVKKIQANGFSKKRLDVLQTRVVEAVGVASQAQVKEINRELAKLSKKLDTLVGKRSSRPEASA